MRLERDERVLFRAHPSWRSRPGYCLRTVLLALVGGVAGGLASAIGHGARVQVPWVVIAVLAVFAWRLGFGQLRLARTTYTLTTRRIVVERGRLVRRRRQAPLHHVLEVYVSQTRVQRLLGVGTVRCEVSGELRRDLRLHGVADPRWVAALVAGELQAPALSWDPEPLAFATPY